ncbi:protein YgfX [Pseudoalteromonas simplex]|uniref:protein YgfX n=1 Tax=Pseudoalteromonas simplex TaxID=2783613 RepID=UPI0018893C49|nr:protein YgfX [Pseudoalteromonas sp. A520]
MYRFTVTNNTPDHKPFVVFFCLTAIILCFAYQHVIAQLLVCFACFFLAILSFKKVQQAQPEKGFIILEQAELRFANDKLKVQGQITAKSYVFANFVVLRLAGFYQSHWLIISSASVDEESFSRLKRAIIAVQQPT